MDIFKMPVHPAADVFPMIDANELQELATDIKANGLLHPIVVKDGLLIDGRNRREACRLAKIKSPAIEELNGIEPEAYIIASNINRRHLTKGQQAMAVAKIYPEPERGKRNDLSPQGTSLEVSKQYLSKARAVLRWAPDMVDGVLSGGTMLNAAFKEANDRKVDSEKGIGAMERLKANAPDLAELVVEERMPLTEAIAAYEKRVQDEKGNRALLCSSIRELLSHAKTLGADYAPNRTRLKGYYLEVEKTLGFDIEQAIQILAEFKESASLEIILEDLLNEKKSSRSH